MMVEQEQVMSQTLCPRSRLVKNILPQSPEDESKYKGVFPNIMIASIASHFDRNDSDKTIDDGRPIESDRYMWSLQMD